MNLRDYAKEYYNADKPQHNMDKFLVQLKSVLKERDITDLVITSKSGHIQLQYKTVVFRVSFHDTRSGLGLLLHSDQTPSTREVTFYVNSKLEQIYNIEKFLYELYDMYMWI